MRLLIGTLMISLSNATLAGAEVVSGTVRPGQETAAVDRLLSGYDKPGTPGLAVGVYQHGKVVLVRTAGYADLEHGVKVTPATRFELGSVSKQFTGFAVAQLAQQGKIDLDADIHRYLPWLPLFGGAKITTRQLLHHTSGLREMHELCGLAGMDCDVVFRHRAFEHIIAQQRALNFEPGTRYSYSNTGYTLLGDIVEAVTGQTLRRYADEAIFRPLNMTSFFLDSYTEIVPNEAYAYTKNGKTWSRSPISSDSVGEGGVQATIGDMMKWVGNFAHPKLGDSALYSDITAPATLSGNRTLLYGFGIFLADFHGHRSLSHTGGMGGYATRLQYLPDDDLGVVALTLNGSYDCVHIVNQILKIYLGAKVAEPALKSVMAADPSLGDTLSGSFVSGRENWPNGVDNELLQISVHDGAVFLGTPLQEVEGGTKETKIVFRRDRTFDDGDYSEKFYRPVIENGRVVAIDKFGTLQPQSVFRYTRFTPIAPTSATLAEFEGRYCSAELDICYTLKRDSNDLLASSLATVEPIRLASTMPDRFDSATSWFFVRALFVRDHSGQVIGVNVSSYRARDTFFSKQ